MTDSPNIYEKLSELLPYGEWTILIIALLGYLFFKLLEKALPAIFKQLSQWFKSGLSEWRENFKIESNLRKYISNASKRNWITSIKSLSKYNLNIDLIDVFQLPLLNGLTSSKNGLNSVLSENHSFAILGKLGSGKSSICNYLSYLYANDLVEKNLGIKDVRLPFHIACGLISDFSKPLYHLISDYYNERGCLVTADFVKKQLINGRCIIIIDGLDEIVDYGDQKKISNLILDCKDTFPKNRFVLSCRELDWEELKVPGFQGYYISDLDKDHAKQLIQKWSSILGKEYENNLKSLTKRITNASKDLSNIYSNYLLLTVLIILSANGFRFKDKRTEIYESIIRVLLNEWSDLRADKKISKKDINSLFKLLQKVSSFLLFSDSNEILDLNNPSFYDFIKTKLVELFDENEYQEPLYVLESLERTGILISVGKSKFKFVTRIFLEYLSALDLRYNFSDLLFEKSVTRYSCFETLLLFFELTDKKNEQFDNLIGKKDNWGLNHYRLLSGMLIRNLVPPGEYLEVKNSTLDFFEKTLLSQKTDRILLENCYKIDKTKTLSLFERYLKTIKTTDVNHDLISSICQIEDENIVDLLESNFKSLDFNTKTLITKELGNNKLSSDFLWKLVFEETMKNVAIKSLTNNSLDNYHICLNIIEDKILLNTADKSGFKNSLETKEIVIDVLKAFNNPETINYFSNNFKKFEIGLLNYIQKVYGEKYFLLISKNFSVNNYVRYFKRPFDLVLGVILSMFLFFPILPIIYLLNLFYNRGPMFFYQERVGHLNKPFKIYKLRTMRINSEDSALQATKNDFRITPFGIILRRFNIDELPVLISILRGEMSFIGPRAQRLIFLKELRKYVEHLPYDELMKHLKPGYTSIRNVQKDIIYDENLNEVFDGFQKEWDYLLNASLSLDLKILLKTFWLSIFSSTAYRGL
ncbi:sugar transferase [Flagellimonas sp. S3867]|uniref:sugar transferase n=1 Tax=Flagellimonas sp. S3867 TaxID=2768063 RepID=UPI001684CD6A|nr:sugar transferase [Flagellimonas sp. S3867]